MNSEKLTENLVELIRRTSCYLPPDVMQILSAHRALETAKSKADFALEIVEQNINLARHYSRPICQDTGHLVFYIHYPENMTPLKLEELCRNAVVTATEKGYLRQNSVNSITGKNSGNNLGAGTPGFHFKPWDKDVLEVKLVQKGGGCENMSAQYKLPATIGGKHYSRDLEGVRAVILDAVHKAQGKGCAPGFLGVCIGGDRADGYAFAKEQLLRELDDTNPMPELAELEARILDDANTLKIGPMGFEGEMTLGSCKIGYLNRLPACYFVTIAYMCWAYRRRGFILNKDGTEILKWQHQKDWEFTDEDKGRKLFELKDVKAVKMQMPMSEADVRSLKVGDVVLLSGTMYTARDAVHKYLYEGGELDVIKGGVIYHCGPVILENPYRVMAAGPTTSAREEPYQGDIIKKFDIKAVIGKGGMGEKTLKACQEHGSVYLHAIGGAAQVYAMSVKDVKGVYLKEFGSPEAVWVLEVEDFPAVVTIDAHGNSLHKDVDDLSHKKLLDIL